MLTQLLPVLCAYGLGDSTQVTAHFVIGSPNISRQLIRLFRSVQRLL